MRVSDAARKLGISERSLYRLVKDGTLPATVRARDRPVFGYELDDHYILNIQKILERDNCSPTPAKIRDIVSTQLID